MTAKEKLVSVIILTYNSQELIEKCIKCINEQDYKNFELIIVDNNSTDGTKDILENIKTKNSNHKIIFNRENLGYNLGNQIGINNSDGEFVVFINPDSFLDKSWLSNIIQVFEKNQNTMIANGIIKNPDTSIQSTGGQMDKYGAVKQRKNNSENYFYASGAAVIFRRELLDVIKLDPNLFLYYDDVDLAWQTKLCGHKIGFCKDAKASHAEGHSLPGLTPKKFYFIVKNRIYVCLKNYSSSQIIKRVFIMITFVILDSLYYSFKFKSAKYFFSGLKALGWNLGAINKLKITRAEIQKQRTISDKGIESSMQKSSIEMKFLKSKL